MPRYVYEKMGITENHAVLIIDGPAEAVLTIKLPTEPSTLRKPYQTFEHVVVFVKSQSDLDNNFPEYVQCIDATGKLWIAWPKKGQLDTDLNIKEVIRIGYNHGLVESTNLRIDDVWTALKFTHPKLGKLYNNSYGILKQ